MDSIDILKFLERYSASEEIDAVIASLFKNKISKDIKKVFIDQKNIPTLELVKLNVLICNNELEEADLCWLSDQSFISKLSAGSLLIIAKTLEKDNQEKMLQLLKYAAQKIGNSTNLINGLGVLNNIDLGKIKKAKLTKTKIAIAGNCTLKPLADYLKVAMLPYNISADVRELPFDQWVNQALDNNSELYKFAPSFLVLYLSSLGLTEAGTKTQFEILEFLKKSVSTILNKTSLEIIMILPEPLEEECFTSSDLYHWRQEFIEQLRHDFFDKVIFVDPTITITEVGRSKWFSSKFWYHGKFPCHPNSLLALGKHISVSIAHCISLPIKVIVCDLDNTLWGGVVGEDGYQNLKLDVHSLGGPYIRLQSFLKSLVKKGILLVAVSKNNDSDVREVFEKRPEMILKWEDFTTVIANWAPKSENIVKISKTLNIGVDYFCFIDDSPFEREEVSAALQEVIVLDLPANPEEMVSTIIKSQIFHIPVYTEEDRKRNIYYKSEIARAEAHQSSGEDIHSFFHSLKLKLYCSRINQQNVDRVVQLINKTNQFNLTTKRYDYDQVNKFIMDTGIFAYSYRVVDKFGDSGVVGVLLSIPQAADKTYYIDTWLLSCRVMGRTIERGIFEHFLRWLKKQDAKKVIGEYIPTKKNIPVKELYASLGFNKIDGDDDETNKYEFQVSTSFFENKYVELIEE